MHAAYALVSKKENLPKTIDFYLKTHFVEKNKALAAYALASNKTKITKNDFQLQNAFCREKKNACGVRTGAENKNIKKLQTNH